MPADATGRVYFYLYPGGRVTLLGVASNVGGIARLTPPGNNQLVEGSNPIEAEYEGNARYEPNYSNTVTVTVIGPVQTVAFAGSQRTVPSPLGATAVRITATGGSGAVAPPCGVSRAAGGFGAVTTGTVALPAGAALIADVGGAGDGRSAGWGGAAGGGAGGHRGGVFSGEGGGSGGATTVQLTLSGVSTLRSRAAAEAPGTAGNSSPTAVAAVPRAWRGNGLNASGGISPGSGSAGGSATTPAGTAGTGAGGGGGGGAHGGLGGSGDSAGAAGGGGGAGSTMTDNSLLTGVTTATASTTGNGTVTLDWLSS